jgi:ABC-type bacteriocin/lantibiotic exporter with double-glycine peptidase domain
MTSDARAFFVPEVLQSSSMDCGPAALAAVLGGFGIRADYEALRSRCQTDVDGTSLDALAGLGSELGLSGERVLVPRDHFCLPEASCLPAIVVTRSSTGLLHFVVVWRALGPLVQVLDPGSGRRWLSRQALLRLMPDFPVLISARRWRSWAGSENAQRPWRTRIAAVGVRGKRSRELLARAADDPTWRSFARLDAAIRFVTALVLGNAVPRGRAAERLLVLCAREEPDASAGQPSHIPPRFHWASDRGAPEGQLSVGGCVIVRFSRVAPEIDGHSARAPQPAQPGASKAPDPLRELWRRARAEPGARLWPIGLALVIQAALVPLEAMLLRGLLGVERELALEYQRLGLGVALGVVFALGLCLEAQCTSALRQIGRLLSVRLHVELLRQLPRLPDDYLLSRPSSDMAARGNTIHLLRDLPTTWAQAARALLHVAATSLGLIWLDPAAAPQIVALVALAVLLPRAFRRSLIEASVRLRAHTTSLDRFRLDALLGASPARVHAAQDNIAAEHEERLCEWSRTASLLNDQQTRILGLQALTNTLLCALLVAGFVLRGGDAAVLPLLVYWALRLPASAGELVMAEQSLRGQRAVLTRLLAPLSIPTPELLAPGPRESSGGDVPASCPGIGLGFHGVSVVAGGHPLLQELTLSVAPGSHVAIVGASGSGKSSLLGVLLGWLRPSAGTLRVDGRELRATDGDEGALRALRDRTAWVDPAAQLWARSVFENLTYGDAEAIEERLPKALEQADLLEVLQGLPEGLATPIGESGARLSGGQGQRLRLARALMRSDARLVLLDEPFRGLERERRRSLLARARTHWQEATLLFVSHDIEDTRGFDRVLVLEQGRIVEDGCPAQLSAREGSRYAALLEAAGELRAALSPARGWQHSTLVEGQLTQSSRGAAP